MQVPIIGQGAEAGGVADPRTGGLIDMSPYEAKVRKDVAAMAHALVIQHAVTVKSAFMAAEEYFRVKDLYLRTGLLEEPESTPVAS